MLKVLIIDDLRIVRQDKLSDFEVHYARTSYDGLLALHGNTEWAAVFFDHDLGGDDTTLSCVDYMAENRDKFIYVVSFIHTSNPVGGDSIERTLNASNLINFRVPSYMYFEGTIK